MPEKSLANNPVISSQRHNWSCCPPFARHFGDASFVSSNGGIARSNILFSGTGMCSLNQNWLKRERYRRVYCLGQVQAGTLFREWQLPRSSWCLPFRQREGYLQVLFLCCCTWKSFLREMPRVWSVLCGFLSTTWCSLLRVGRRFCFLGDSSYSGSRILFLNDSARYNAPLCRLQLTCLMRLP